MDHLTPQSKVGGSEMGGALSSPSQSSASGAQPSPLQPQGKAFTPKSTQKRLTSTQPLSSHGKEEAVAPPKMSLLAQDISATPTGFPSGPTTSSQGQQVRPEEGEKGQWLLVFGFKRSEESEVLAELQACGDVVARHKPSEDANFMYVQLASKDGVERASGLHGKVVVGKTMLGVIKGATPPAWAPTERPSSAPGHSSRRKSSSLGRDHAFSKSPASAVPKGGRTLKDKISEYIFGA